MRDDLERLIRRINVRARLNDPEAKGELLELAEQHPREPNAWNAVAYAYAQENHFPEAVGIMTRMIALAPQLPESYFTRGWYALAAADYESSIADFLKGLALCNERNEAYDQQTVHLRLAEANYQLGRKSEALRNLRYVKEGAIIWTVKGRTKDELLALCADAVTPENDGRYQQPLESTETNAQTDVDQWQLPDEPDEEEAALTEILGPEALAKADVTLMKWIRPRWHKVSRVVVSAVEADDHEPTSEFVCLYLRRLIGLAESGAFEVAGNIRRPTFSEVRLPERD